MSDDLEKELSEVLQNKLVAPIKEQFDKVLEKIEKQENKFRLFKRFFIIELALLLLIAILLLGGRMGH